jgi:hypothetical protein
VVDRLTDTGVGTDLTGDLRYAISHAADGDAIAFSVTGTINLSGALPSLTHSVSIEGPGADQLTVRRTSSTLSGDYGIFTVTSGTTTSIARLTITNGHAYGYQGGGGIANGGRLTVSNCTISGNTADLGLFAEYGGFGGGIYNAGTLTLNDSTVGGNVAVWGPGGGIYNESGGTVTLNNSTVSGNDADFGGGGIVNGGTLTLNNSTVSGNGTNYSGGGIVNVNGGTLTANNSTVSGNISASGGGIYNGGTVTLINSTVSGNDAYFVGVGGGGIYNGGTLHAWNTILAGNTATYGPDLSGNLGSLGYNLIGNTSGGSGFVATDLVGTAALPINPRLGPLQDNGGPTQTMALLAGSPALNAGDSAQLGVADQRGVVRAGGVNIGAYQASASSLVLTAPATVTAGTPFDVTVKAVDTFGQTAIGYRGTAHFTSSDPQVDPQTDLPGDYTFTSADAGMHTFSSAVTLKTAASQTVTATDTASSSITGNASVSVSPAAADHLLFLQTPTDTAAGQTISPAVMVAVVDPFGNTVTSDNSDTITLTIGTNPGGGTLSGTLTVTARGGLATFADLSIDLAGDGYTLHATTTGLTDADSGAFRIT